MDGRNLAPCPPCAQVGSGVQERWALHPVGSLVGQVTGSRAVMMTEDVGPGVGTAQVQMPPLPPFAVGSPASGFASLCLSFHIYKMGVNTHLAGLL